MHWVIQDNLYNEAGYHRLVEALERQGVPHSFHTVIPFSHELDPDIDLPNPVYVCGALTMGEVAKRKGWLPGAFINENFNVAEWSAMWGEHCLNHGARIVALKDVEPWHDEFFLRPDRESKSFDGLVMTWMEVRQSVDLVAAIKKRSPYSAPTPETMAVVAPLKAIFNERRYFLVDRRIVTSSQYKLGSRVAYDATPNTAADAFAFAMAQIWTPARAFVLDVAETDEGFRIVEINSINSAGFYEADCAKLVDAIESMGY